MTSAAPAHGLWLLVIINSLAFTFFASSFAKPHSARVRLAHDSGHLPGMMFGWKSNPYVGPFYLISSVFIGGGFWLLSSAWRVLYATHRNHTLITSGALAQFVETYQGYLRVVPAFIPRLSTSRVSFRESIPTPSAGGDQ